MQDANDQTPQLRENTNQNPELLTRDEVSRLLHVSISYVDSHMPDLPKLKLGRKVLFLKDDVLDWLYSHKQEGDKKCKSKTIISRRQNP